MLLHSCIMSGYEVHQGEKVSFISKGLKLFMVSPERNALSSTIQHGFCNSFQDMPVFNNILSSPFVYYGRKGSLWVFNGISEVFCTFVKKIKIFIFASRYTCSFKGVDFNKNNEKILK